MASPLAFPTFRATSVPVLRAKRHESQGPRTAPSALRIPNPKYLFTPLRFASATPQVFVHEGARQALERRFEAAHAGPVVLHISDNVTSMVRIARRGEQLRARVHHMFLDAPPLVQLALVRYVLGSDRDASSIVGRFIAENHHRIRAARSPQQPLKTKGEAHDLYALFRKVNDRYFDGTHDALVTWGRGSPGKKPLQQTRKSIKLGSYSATERLIRVHPSLDRAWVPKYFVEFVLFHEMLHHVMPATASGDRRVHPPEFRRRERLFHAYERAVRWEKEHIARLLRTLAPVFVPRAAAWRELRRPRRVLWARDGEARGRPGCRRR